MTDPSSKHPSSLSHQPITEMMKLAGGDSKLAGRLYVMLRKLFLQTCDNKRRQLGAGDSLAGDYVPYKVFVQLLKRDPQLWNDRKHILACAAQGMEWHIRSYQKQQRTLRRGGQARTTSLSGSDIRDPNSIDVEAKLIAADTFARLLEKSPTNILILRMKFEMKMTYAEIAETMDLTVHQVEYRVTKALRWIQQEAANE